ncbi:hypothetical protein GALMADRAFT_243516 [Galerina marginata CBS 339.88]|uniref:F-box domain-containing protein n=1 Tax=Galerina marginata (strain CBS 339.88) TaxID=685588 RepID=A0A067T8K9_GALM3|nr:hypothetical protein GALMADRAFT_243516 [Galerina marginata CBS 339.88]
MGGSDFYCSVSGTRYFLSTTEFRNAVFSRCDLKGGLNKSSSSEVEDDNDPQTHNRLNNVGVSDEGLRYSEEDVEASSTYVAIVPYETDEDGDICINTDSIVDDYEGPDEYTEETIVHVFNVVPGRYPILGDYINQDPHDPNAYGGEYLVASFGFSLIITYTAYLILKQAAPQVTPHALYALAYGAALGDLGHIKGVDYGPVGHIINPDYVDWLGICEDDDWYRRNDFWKNLLTQKNKTDEEILHDAWRGRGNMWVFVRPDRFPIAETIAAAPFPTFSVNDSGKRVSPFESLPVDILLAICEEIPIRTTFALISTCKRVRASILPHADSITHQRLKADEPWYLPAGPFELKDKKHGREEVDWWASQWAAGGISGEGMDLAIPWFLYRKQCSSSMSMWNRKRIWDVAMQLGRLVDERGT